MKYIEIIIGLNVLIHWSLVVVVCYLFRCKVRRIFTLISVVIDVFYIFGYLFYPYDLESFKYILIFIISYLPFMSKRLSDSLFKMLIYLMFNFTLGGTSKIIFLIINNFIGVIISLFLILLIVSIFVIYRRLYVNVKCLEYDVLIDEKYYLKGFYDTGNFLLDDKNIPVVFVKNGYCFGKYVKDLSVKTVTGFNSVKLYDVDSFMIKINNKYIKKDVYIAYSDIAYDVMFGSDLLGG